MSPNIVINQYRPQLTRTILKINGTSQKHWTRIFHLYHTYKRFSLYCNSKRIFHLWSKITIVTWIRGWLDKIVFEWRLRKCRIFPNAYICLCPFIINICGVFFLVLVVFQFFFLLYFTKLLLITKYFCTSILQKVMHEFECSFTNVLLEV